MPGPKLIYLDTSHQHLLAEWAHHEPEAFEGFCARWRAGACALVVARTHLLEMRRHGNRAVREGRLSLFRKLVPIVSDTPSDVFEPQGPTLFSHREMLLAFRRANMLSGTGPDFEHVLDRWCKIFPGCFETPEEAELLAVLEDADFDVPIRIIETAMRTGAQARTRPNELPYERTRLGALPNAPLTKGQIADAKRQTLDALGDGKIWSDLQGVIPDEQLSAMRRSVEEFMIKSIDSFAAVGPRQAMVDSFNLTADRGTANSHIDTLVQRHVFEDCASTLFKDFLNMETSAAQTLAKNFPLSARSGTWIRNAVELEMRKGKADGEAGDEFDLDHVAYPYVDILTADQRTSQFSEQVLRRPELPPRVQGVRPAARAGNLAELLELLEPMLGRPQLSMSD